MIEISEQQIDRVNLLLGELPGASQKAFYNAINRGTAKVKTESLKEITEVYAITRSNVNKYSAISSEITSTEHNVVGVISFHGTKIPLYRYDVSKKTPSKGIVSARQLRSESRTPFEKAFIAEMPDYGHIGMFERKGKKRLPITEISGSSITQMVENAVVMDKVEAQAQETVDKRIEQEITRILNGYGV